MTLVVSNASPLIALNQIGELRLIQELFGEVTIPLAVAREVAPSVRLPVWVKTRSIHRPMPGEILRAVAGTLGLLNRAKEKGLITAVRPHAESLVRGGFFATPALVERILRDAGETASGRASDPRPRS